MAVGDRVTLDGGGVGYLADWLAEIDSTVAIADSTALEQVSAPKAEWQGYVPVDTVDFEDIPFVHGAAVDNLVARLADEQDSEYVDVQF